MYKIDVFHQDQIAQKQQSNNIAGFGLFIGFVNKTNTELHQP